MRKRSERLGVTAQDLGRQWEQIARGECDALRMLNRANVERIYPPMAPTGRNKGYSTGGATVDFDGHIIKAPMRGRRVCFDTKSTEDAVGFNAPDLISNDQINRLSRFSSEGCLCFIYVMRQLEMAQERYLLPVDGIARIAGFVTRLCRPIDIAGQETVAKIKWGDLKELGFMVKREETWLDALLRLWEDAE